MIVRFLKSWIALAAIFMFCSTATWAQTAPTARGATTPTDPAAQDTQFIALFSSRDTQLAFIAELKRIISYHENLRGRIEQRSEFASSNEELNRAVTQQISKELESLQKLESSIAAAESLAQKIKLVKDYDDDFPLSLSPRGPPSSRARSGEDESAAFLRRERLAANDAFQNVSSEIKEFKSNYDAVFADIENWFRSSRTLPSLEQLPRNFYQLVDGVRSFDALTEEQIRTAIAKYRTVLQAALSEVQRQAPATSTGTPLRAHLLAQLEPIRGRLVALLADKTTELGKVDKSLAGAAKALYGSKVGADSFNYLLIVFAIVFLVVMAAPKLYPEVVAVNVLKSEFLLQFSTVFVLVAAIIILAIGGLIKEDQLPVLLAGISGYVLGQLGSASRSSNQPAAQGSA